MTPISDIEKLERLLAEATPGPWAWDERGDKVSEWGLGTAYRLQDGVEVPVSGMFTDEGVLYDEYVCSHEAATGNYKDPELITVLRNLAPSLIADWKAMRGEIERLTKERDEAYERAARVCETSRTVPGILIGTTFKEPIYKDGDRCAKAIRNLKAKDEQ